MCGICGVVYADGDQFVDSHLVRKMGSAIKHRGPDDTGVWVNRNVGLGFQRLAIIDLSPAGNQPMTNEDQTVWIVFNGEIYNFLELRAELLAKGHRFSSHTDTETIIHLWEEEGERCVERLRGMFAFAIWDSNQRSLFLARDREGQKPLFYTSQSDRLVFASEIKAILQSPVFLAEPDLEAIHHYLAFQSVPAPYSAFKGIKKLPPAHSLLYKEGKISLRKFWKLSYANPRIVETQKEMISLQEEIISRLRESVHMRLMSDVPLGAFLSGGIDSSIVVALMSEILDEPVKTFSIGFDHKEYNELKYARMVAERYKTDHHEFVVKPDATAILSELVWHYNEPFADSSAIPTYYVCKLAREHVKVVLTGDAGDENFAGYARYGRDVKGVLINNNNLATLFKRAVRRNPLTATLLNLRDPIGTFRRIRDLSAERLLYYLRITHFSEAYQNILYSRDFRAKLRNIYTIDWVLDRFQKSDATNFLDSTLDLDLSLYLPDTLMTKMDVASMAHSLEARAPMLDHHFLEFCAAIPHELKLKDGRESKFILKKAVEPYLPNGVIYRKKMGFGVPIAHWFRTELKDMLYDTLLSSRSVQRGYFQYDYVRSLIDQHQKGENLQHLLWNLLMLELWHQMFIDK